LLGSGRPPPPLPAGVHPAVAAIVRKALTYAHDSRCSTAAEMREQIERAMIASRMMATSAEVAAFAAQYVGDRAEKRRRTVDDALALAERRRLEERFEPRGRATLALATDSAASLPPSSVPSLNPPRDFATLADTPEALGTPIDLVAKLTARLSDAPQPSSYATLGLAAVDASAPSMPAVRSRKGPIVMAGLLIVGVGVAAAVRLDVLGTQSKASHAPPPVAVAGPRSPLPPPASAPTAAQPPAPTTASWALLPTVAASALPKAGSTPPPAPGADLPGRGRAPRWQPHRAPPSAPAPTPTAVEPSSEPEATAQPAPAPAPVPAPAPALPQAPAKTGTKGGPVDDGF
jgi:hypothetical protein